MLSSNISIWKAKDLFISKKMNSTLKSYSLSNSAVKQWVSQFKKVETPTFTGLTFATLTIPPNYLLLSLNFLAPLLTFPTILYCSAATFPQPIFPCLPLLLSHFWRRPAPYPLRFHLSRVSSAILMPMLALITMVFVTFFD